MDEQPTSPFFASPKPPARAAIAAVAGSAGGGAAVASPAPSNTGVNASKESKSFFGPVAKLFGGGD